MNDPKTLNELMWLWVREILKVFVTPPMVWWLLAIFGIWLAKALVAKLPGMIRRRRLRQAGMPEIDRLAGREFETFLNELFRDLGYRVEQTRYVGDKGADLVLSKGGVRTVVQAKRWSGPVGVAAIQQAHTAKTAYDCAEAIVVTNSTFTRQAEELARKAGVVLWDRTRLASAIRDTGRRPAEIVEGAAVPVPAATAAVCCVCGVAVSEKVSDYCRDNAKRFDGRVYCFKHQRTRR